MRLASGFYFTPTSILFLISITWTNPAVSQTKGRDNREQLILQIQQTIGAGDLQTARHMVSEAAKKYPRDAGFDNLEGIVEAESGNSEAAERSFKQAVSRSPRFRQAYLNLGRLYRENTGRDTQASPKALDTYLQLLAFDPTNTEANYQASVLLMGQGAYQKSLDHLLLLPQEQRNDPSSLAVRCADLAGLKSRTGADLAAERLRSHAALSVLDVEMISPILASAGRSDIVVSLLETLSKKQPLTSPSLHTLALAYEATGKFVQSRDILEKAFADHPDAALLLDLARVAYKQSDKRGSLGYLAHAKELEPRNASIHYSFGFVCLELNFLVEARKAIGEAVRLEPDNPVYNYAMGSVSAFSEDPADAVPYFQKYLELKPQDPQGKLSLGVVYFKAKNYDAALPLLKESASSKQTAPSAHYYLGRIEEQLGNVDEAIRELQLALEINPGYADALAEIGRCRVKKREYSQAEDEFDRALALDRNHYAANFNLLMLYTITKDPRREDQSRRFEQVKKLTDERTQELMRIIEIKPFGDSQKPENP